MIVSDRPIDPTSRVLVIYRTFIKGFTLLLLTPVPTPHQRRNPSTFSRRPCDGCEVDGFLNEGRPKSTVDFGRLSVDFHNRLTHPSRLPLRALSQYTTPTIAHLRGTPMPPISHFNFGKRSRRGEDLQGNVKNADKATCQR